MRQVFKTAAFLLILQVIAYSSFSQAEEMEDYEAYSKANIAFTNFKMLGVTTNEFAKCVESVNYLHPEKRHKIVMLDGVVFVDDGKDYDLVAGDGVLTSKILFGYSEITPPIEAGKYRDTRRSPVLYDSSFVHAEKINSPNGFVVTCKFRWTPCKQMTGLDRILCEMSGWPYGAFTISDCEVKWV